jgi:hypothetical protein
MQWDDAFSKWTMAYLTVDGSLLRIYNSPTDDPAQPRQTVRIRTPQGLFFALSSFVYTEPVRFLCCCRLWLSCRCTDRGQDWPAPRPAALLGSLREHMTFVTRARSFLTVLRSARLQIVDEKAAGESKGDFKAGAGAGVLSGAGVGVAVPTFSLFFSAATPE